MAASIQRAVSDGTLVNLSLSIDYFDRAEISVLIDDVPVPAEAGLWAWVGTTDTVITFTPAIANGVEVMLQRSTATDEPRHVFSLGAQFLADALDENFEQVLRVAQEAKEGGYLAEVFNDVDMHTFRLANLGPAIEPGDAVPLSQYQADAASAYAAAAAAEAALAAIVGETLIASAIGFTPGGSLSATEVQSALAELDTDKASTSALAGVYTDLAVSSGAGLVGWIQSGIGSVVRWVRDKLREHPSVLDFGATGLGVVSDNAAIQAAVDAHQRVYMPPGTYLAHRISIPAGHVLYGAGEKTILKRDYYVGATETALTILAADSQLRDLVIDGSKATAPAAWGTGTYIQNVDGAAVAGVKYKDCKRDGLFALNATDFTLTNIATETNERCGIAITGNCHGFDISHIRSTGDIVAGVDLEPDAASTENTNFRVSDVLVDGCLLSVQGLSTSIINRGGVLSNLVARNTGVIRFNKFDDLAVTAIACDSTSALKIEDSYPTVFGRGTGSFGVVSLAGRASTAVNSVAEPYFTSQASLSWTASTSGAGASIAHVNVTGWGKYAARIGVTGGASGNFAFYVTPSILVGADEWVSLGGSLKAIVGRPYIEVQYRVGTTLLDTYRAAGGAIADGIWHNFMKFTKTPATCDNVRFLIGGTFDVAGGDFSGDFDGFYVYRNAFKQDAGTVDKTLRAAVANNPVSLADGVGVTTTVPCTGAALGDSTSASFSLDLQGVTLTSWVSAADTISVRLQNESGGLVDLANGVLAVKVLK